MSTWVNNFFMLFNVAAIPIIYILLTIPGIMPWSNMELRFLSWCHVVGVLSPWVGSFVYHLFMNLESGERIYHRLLQLDMLGIWISQSFGKFLCCSFKKGSNGTKIKLQLNYQAIKIFLSVQKYEFKYTIRS